MRLGGQQGESIRYDVEVYARKSGKEVMVMDFTLLPVRDEEGRVVFLLPEGRDITEKKAHEREIARQREELAKLDKLKTQFFSNISHEFRTPLTLMLGPLEDGLADLEEPLGPRQRERASMVQRNGLRMHKLVNALLDFSRVEAGRIQAFFQPTDLAPLTHDLASSFRSACEKSGLTLTINSPALPKPVFVDHEMWEKIVLNLVSNAFKFTLDGGIKVDVTMDGNDAILRVSDTGTGIPESELPLIFDRFHRVAEARGRSNEGTGIGLALVKELIELHKGVVSVESTLGKGSAFTVRVPFGTAHLPQDRLKASRPQASTATRADAFVSEALRWLPDDMIAEELEVQDEPLREPEGPTRARAHVLLADDNSDMRDYLFRLLTTSYEVTATADGEEALSVARRARPDLILSDVMMPRLDGFGLLQKLRDDPELRGVPVIFLSARAGDEAKIEGLERGADDYLVKPFSARELRARVAANIELARARAQSARAQERLHIWNVSQDLLVVADLEGKYLMVNPAWTATLGWSEVDLLGKNSQWLLHPDDRERTRAEIESLAAGRRTQWLESRYRHKDGSYRWLSWRAVPDEGRIYAMGRDVTERKQTEHALQEARRELASVSRLTTLAEMAASIAHEIKQPLSAIALNGNAGMRFLSRAEPDVKEALAALKCIVDDSHRTSEIVTNIRAMFRRDNHEKQRLNVHDLVREALSLAHGEIESQRAALRIELPDESPQIAGERVPLQQVFLNLTMNALDAMSSIKDRDRLLLIKSESVVPDGVLITVADSGTGIDPKNMDRIFEPFFTTKPQGMGMGLSICRSIVEAHGGRLWASRGTPHGSVFHVQLPTSDLSN